VDHKSGSREAGDGTDGGASGSAGKGRACDRSAASMVALAEQRLFFPRFLKGDACIRMLRPQDLCSLSFKTLVVCGFVNGFLPCRDYFDGTVTPLDKQEKMHASDVRLLYLIISAAQGSVVFSHFKRIDIESAERLKLKVARIRFEKGERICLITPSELLGLLGL
jgi:hypothetical protein